MIISERTLLSTEKIREITGLENSKMKNEFSVKKIAHAGGEINKAIYTNSFEALNENLRKGFSYFEIDFVFTEDRQLVCLHDWNGSVKRLLGLMHDEKLTLEDFKKVVKENATFQICTFSDLVDWLGNNPGTYIVTDVKEDNLKALQLISKSTPHFKKRIIPQIFVPEDFYKVKKMGYEQIIWTLYGYGGDDDKVISSAKQFDGSFAITMPKDRAKSSLPTRLGQMGIPTYAHTINALDEESELKKVYNVTEIYTDFLEP
jgi:glycerophosphoryl diester phosphodiesterase